MRRAAPFVAALTALVGLGSLAGCSSSSGPNATGRTRSTGTTARSAGPTVPARPCLLSAEDARALLGVAAKAAAPPPLTGVQKPVSQCLFAAPSGSSVELTTFTGTEMFSQLAILVPNPEVVADMGDRGYCGGGPGTDLASFSCLFVKNASTYVLAVQVPLDKDAPALHDRVKASALDVAKRAAA
jgi:hypothetical protein